MMKLPCRCKFCGRNLLIKVHPGGAAMFGDLEDFVTSLAACDQCADLRGRVVATVDYIDHKKFDPAIEPELKRELVARAAEKFANRICDFYRVQRVFQPDLVQMFMEKRADAVARTYENQIRKHVGKTPLELKSDPVKDAKRAEESPEWMDAPEYTEKEGTYVTA